VDSFSERDHVAQPRAAFVASEKMFLYRRFFGFRQRGDPIVG